MNQKAPKKGGNEDRVEIVFVEEGSGNTELKEYSELCRESEVLRNEGKGIFVTPYEGGKVTWLNILIKGMAWYIVSLIRSEKNGCFAFGVYKVEGRIGDEEREFYYAARMDKNRFVDGEFAIGNRSLNKVICPLTLGSKILDKL